MRRNDLTEIKALDPKALKDRVLTLRDEIMDYSIKNNMKNEKNVKLLGHKRRDLAQILTVLNQKLTLEKLQKEAA